MHVNPPWVNKLLFLPAIKDQRKEPPMTDRLAALVRRVAELRQARLEACYCTKEFYLRRIHPLGRRKTLAFESPRLADPSCDPLPGNFFIFSFNAECPPLSRSDILFFYLVPLTADEIDGFVAHLFDRGVPTARPDAVPLPFSSENPPPLVRVIVLP
jgi:hypothetical protein